MAQKLFSVITPVRNGGKTIVKTIRSVLAQGEDLVEYVVIDGMSTDRTVEIIQAFGDKLKFISEPDKGIYDAMNKGIELSSGKYLCFLGAGDCLRPRILARISGLMPKRNLALVYGNAYMEDTNTVYDGRFNQAKLIQRNICHQAIFYARDIFCLVGKYDLRFRQLADWALNIRCFCNKSIQKNYIPYVISSYEGYGASVRESDSHFVAEYSRLLRKLPNEIVDLTATEELASMATAARYEQAPEQIKGVLREIAELVRAGESLILVDGNELWASDVFQERRIIPFLEREGQYWGDPPDDETAIRELERLWKAGAGFIVFWWSAFWWFDYYSGFHRYLRSKFRCVLKNDRLVIFDLRS